MGRNSRRYSCSFRLTIKWTILIILYMNMLMNNTNKAFRLGRWALVGLSAWLFSPEAAGQAACTPSISLSPSSGGKVCPNTTITLGLSNNSSVTGYSWTGPSNTTATNPTLAVGASAQTVQVTLTMSAGCTSPYTTSILVDLNNVPTVTYAGPGSICEGATYLPTASCPGCSPSGYTWSKGGAGDGFVTLNSTGTNSPTFTVQNPTVGLTNNATITVQVVGTNAQGCQSTPVIQTISITEAPVITAINVSDNTACHNQVITLTPQFDNTTCTGCSIGNYNWSGSPQTVTLPSSSTLTHTASNTGATSLTNTFNLSVTNSNGCSTTGTVPVTFNPLPNFTITTTPALSVCAGTNQVYTAPAGPTYTWTTSSGTLSGTGNATTSTFPASATPYTVAATATDANGCSASDNEIVTVHFNPSISVTASANPICTPSSTTVGVSCTGSGCTPHGTATTAYNWASGITDGNTSAVVTPPGGTTTYQITYTNDKGCTATANNVITVNSTPVITMPTGLEICEGESQAINITVSAATNTGSTPTGNVYVWNTSPVLSTEDITVTPTSNTTYNVTVTTSYTNGSCTATANTQVSVNDVPTLELPDAPVCTNEVFNYEAITNGGVGPYSFTWTNGGGSTLTSGTNNFITVNAGGTPGTYPFSVTVSDGAGCSVSNGGDMTVAQCGNEFIKRNKVGGYCRGENISFWVEGEDPGAEYEWFPSGSIDPTITVSPTLADTMVAISVVVKVNGGVTVAAILYDTVYFNDPTPVLIAPDSLCFGTRDTITLDTSSCTGCSSYSWSASGGAPIAPGSSYNFAPTVTRNYSVTVTDVDGCTATDSRTVFVKPLPGVNISQGDTARYCPEGSVALDANPTVCNGCSYLWNTGATSRIVSVNSQGDFHVTVTERGCIDRDTVHVFPYISPQPFIINSDSTVIGVLPPPNGFTSTPYLVLCNGVPDTLTATNCPSCNFVWNTGSTSQSIIAPSAGAMYYAQVIDTNGCRGITNPIIVQNSTVGNASVATALPSIVCNGDSAVLSVTPCVNCNYQWYQNIPGTDTIVGYGRVVPVWHAGNFYARVVNRDSCEFFTNTVSISVLNSTLPPIYSSVDSICSGDTVRLWTLNNPNYDYQWYRNGNIISAATDSTYTTFQTGDYLVAITYPNSCTVFSDTLTIGTASFSADARIATDTLALPSNATVTICNGDSIEIFTTLYPNYQYQWYKNGILIAGATGASYFAKTVGDYYVHIVTDFGCSYITNAKRVANSSLSSATLTVDDFTICPGDSTRIRSSLSVGSDYQWFRGNTLLPADTNSTYYAHLPGSYYVIVSNTGCTVSSDTVTILTEGVVFPSLNATATRLCNGVTPVLTTADCIGCNYTWLRNGVPIFGALNDSIYTVTQLQNDAYAVDADTFAVRVLYPSGCSDTSNQIAILDGTFDLSINYAALTDTIICNGNPVLLTVVDSSNQCPGPGCFFEWFYNGIPLAITGVNTYPADDTTTGAYSVRITNNFSCFEISDPLTVDAINLYPNITSDATDICGVSPVTMTLTNPCSGCSYQWFRGYTTAIAGATGTSYASNVAGIYTVRVTNAQCVEMSNPITLNTIAGLNIQVNVTDTSICDGQTITLSRIGGSCSGCVFQWLRDGLPIPGATVHTYTTDSSGFYSLQMIQTTNNCIDTSAATQVREVFPTVGFNLDLSAIGSGIPPLQLPATGNPVDMDMGLFPAYLRGGFNNGRYTNSPLTASGNATLFNDAVPPNQFNIFNPSTSGSGYHEITFTYDTLGCSFSTSDLIFVLDAPDIDIINTNPLSAQYEACVSDTLEIILSNMRNPMDGVFVFNENDQYLPFPLAVLSPTPITYGVGNTVYSDTFRVVVPEWAKESYLMLTSSTGFDTIFTPFVLIHNADLTFAGLPTTLCSNGTSVSLVGNPSGGYFTATYPNGSLISGGGVAGTNINPTLFNPAMYTQDSMLVKVIYNYPFTYTNGNSCPLIDTVSQQTVARAVFLNSVDFNKIAVSQTDELLTNLIYSVSPYTSSPSQWQHGFRFSGSFTDPVGEPLNFLPSNAGVGTHPISYSIQNGVCSNSAVGNIVVINAPTPLAIADTICRSNPPVFFSRENLFGYNALTPTFIAPGVVYLDTFNILQVTSINSNEGIDTLNPALGLEQYRYNPAAVTGNIDTIRITYSFTRIETVAGLPIDTIDYVIASITLPIYIEDTIDVEIIDTLVNTVYCEQNINYLMAGNPFGGYFELQGGTGAFAGRDTLDFAIFNPFVIHGNESTDVTYTLTYTKVGFVCRSQDSMQILIPEPLDASFATVSGERTYCDSEPADPIIVATPSMAPLAPIGTLLVGGVAQANLEFNPLALDPGIYLVQYQVQDIHGCQVTSSDTFEVFPLPNVYFSATAPNIAFESRYCTNDSAFYFQVHPAPICSQSNGTGVTKLSESFEGGLFPPNSPLGVWNRFNLNPGASPWELSSFNSNTGTNNAFVNVSSNAINAWLITPAIPMTVGNMYRIQYYVRAGAQNCPTCPDASLEVSVVQGTSVLAHQNFGTTLLNAPALTNEVYIPISHDFICPVSGSYTFAFHSNSAAGLARSLRVDDVIVTEISPSNCVSGGIGSLFGDGVTYQGDSTYLFTPTTLTPGNMAIKYLFINTHGCLDSAVAPITVHQHVTPQIVGLDPTYCVNSPTDTLTTIPSNGVFPSGFTTLPLAGPITTNLQQIPRPYYDPNTATTGEIIRYAYVDPNTGCLDYDWDTVQVFAMPDTLTYAGLSPEYCEADDTITLNVQVLFGSPLAGTFYAPGVINGAGGPGVALFSPTQAVLDMGHIGDTVMTYIYPLANGCVDTLRQNLTIHAMPDLSFTNMPDSICLNADPFLIVVNNHEVSGSMGQFSQNILLPPLSGLFTGAVMNANDSIVPQQVTAGTYPVSYTYTDANNCTSTISQTVRVDTVPVIYFTFAPSTPDSIFCELNDPGSLLLAFPAYYPGSGYLQFGAQSYDRSFYQIDPLALATPPANALYPIFYSFTDMHGCTGTGTDSIEVRPYPRIDLSTVPTAFCDADDTLYVNLMGFLTPPTPLGGQFSDNLPVTSIYQDSLLDLNAPAGTRDITYFYLDTLTGCYNSETITVNVYNTPSLDFQVLGGCVGEEIIFRGDAIDIEPGLDTISNIVWTFGDGNSYNYVPTNPTVIEDTTYVYSTNNVYTVGLQVTNQGLCTSLLEKQVIVSPTVSTYPYFEDFEASQGGWYADQPIAVANSIWGHTAINGNHISDPGTMGWKTAPTAPYTYQPNDNGWVLSPCFDLRYLTRPMIAMDAWRDMNPGIDGAVMEYYDPYTLQWQRLGNPNRGINWYTSDIVLSRPGNQANVSLPRGWTGLDEDWETTRYRLDDLMYRNFVRFRIAFSAFNTTNLDAREGMAFDNVWVGNRERNVLVEHFSNEMYEDVDEVDNYVYDLIFNQNYGRDVILLQYQTELSGDDNINEENNVDPSARILLYGINDDNQAIVDGTRRDAGVSDELTEYELDYDMLQFPAFDIDINQFNVVGNVANTEAVVTALQAMPEDDYAVHTVIIEDTLPSDAGHTLQAVVRRMLPVATGRRFYQSWNIGDNVTVTNTWTVGVDYGTFADASNLHLVVFVQNMSTEEIFQAASTRDISIYFPPDTITGTTDPIAVDMNDFELTKVKVYPNPAIDYFNVEFEEPLDGDYQWRLVDIMGRVLETGNAAAGTKNFMIDTYNLSSGSYFFIIHNEHILTQRQVIVNRP